MKDTGITSEGVISFTKADIDRSVFSLSNAIVSLYDSPSRILSDLPFMLAVNRGLSPSMSCLLNSVNTKGLLPIIKETLSPPVSEGVTCNRVRSLNSPLAQPDKKKLFTILAKLSIDSCELTRSLSELANLYTA